MIRHCHLEGNPLYRPHLPNTRFPEKRKPIRENVSPPPPPSPPAPPPPILPGPPPKGLAGERPRKSRSSLRPEVGLDSGIPLDRNPAPPPAMSRGSLATVHMNLPPPPPPQPALAGSGVSSFPVLPTTTTTSSGASTIIETLKLAADPPGMKITWVPSLPPP